MIFKYTKQDNLLSIWKSRKIRALHHIYTKMNFRLKQIQVKGKMVKSNKRKYRIIYLLICMKKGFLNKAHEAKSIKEKIYTLKRQQHKGKQLQNKKLTYSIYIIEK